MARLISARTLLSKYVHRKDRVLLINPPVYETRYNWIRWNQPLDLLKIGAHLRSHVRCKVDLLDFMLPDAEGHVPKQRLPGSQRHHSVAGYEYPTWHFGKPYSALSDWLIHKDRRERPTQVWITSLCSYWFASTAETCRLVRQLLPDTAIVTLGQHPRLTPEHAIEACAADFVVSDTTDLDNTAISLGLYCGSLPTFVALRPTPETAESEVKEALQKNIFHFTFFDDDLSRDNWEPFKETVAKTRGLHRQLRFHVICGLNPAALTPSIASLLVSKNFAEFHCEEADSRDDLDLDAYRRARAYFAEAGLEGASDRLSGFVWIGRPNETLEGIIARSFTVLQHLGSLILKPFSPTPGSPIFKRNAKYLGEIPPRNLSPHLFPFAEYNRISREEYHDLYRMAAFLNEKVRNRSFEFLDDSLGARLLRSSLRREVWKLGQGSVGITD